MYIENLKDLLAVSMRVLDAVVNIADVEIRILQPLRHYSEQQATQQGLKWGTVGRLSAGEKGIVVLLRFTNKWPFIGPTWGQNKQVSGISGISTDTNNHTNGDYIQHQLHVLCSPLRLSSVKGLWGFYNHRKRKVVGTGQSWYMGRIKAKILIRNWEATHMNIFT